MRLPGPSDSVVVVGGVGQLYQGDLDAGRLAAETLAAEEVDGAVVEDFSYGAVAVVQRLEELRPAALVLVGAEPRGRPAGTVERRPARPAARTATEAGAFVGGAITGHVTIDLLIEVAAVFGALPDRTVVVEIEPATVEPSVEISPVAAAALDEALNLVRAEVRAAVIATRAPG